MARKTEITLDEQKFTVPAFNFGQLEQLTATFSGGDTAKTAFDILRIAWPRVETDVKLEDLAPTFDEMTTAVSAILAMSGMTQNPQQPPGLKLVPPAAS